MRRPPTDSAVSMPMQSPLFNLCCISHCVLFVLGCTRTHTPPATHGLGASCLCYLSFQWPKPMLWDTPTVSTSTGAQQAHGRHDSHSDDIWPRGGVCPNLADVCRSLDIYGQMRFTTTSQPSLQAQRDLAPSRFQVNGSPNNHESDILPASPKGPCRLRGFAAGGRVLTEIGCLQPPPSIRCPFIHRSQASRDRSTQPRT